MTIRDIKAPGDRPAPLDPFSTEHTIGHVREFVREIAETGAIPLMIGGDHSLLWPGASPTESGAGQSCWAARSVRSDRMFCSP